MKSIKFAFFATVLAVFAPPVSAEFAPITGAWGVKLGQIWGGEKSPNVSVTKFDVDTSTYYFVPAKPTPDFRIYQASVTPKTKQVAYIAARTTECGFLRKTILPTLEKKYGKAEVIKDAIVQDAHWGKHRYLWAALIKDGDSANRKIVARCWDRFSTGGFLTGGYLQYEDENLAPADPY